MKLLVICNFTSSIFQQTSVIVMWIVVVFNETFGFQGFIFVFQLFDLKIFEWMKVDFYKKNCLNMERLDVTCERHLRTILLNRRITNYKINNDKNIRIINFFWDERGWERIKNKRRLNILNYQQCNIKLYMIYF